MPLYRSFAYVPCKVDHVYIKVLSRGSNGQRRFSFHNITASGPNQARTVLLLHYDLPGSFTAAKRFNFTTLKYGNFRSEAI